MEFLGQNFESFRRSTVPSAQPTTTTASSKDWLHIPHKMDSRQISKDGSTARSTEAKPWAISIREIRAAKMELILKGQPPNGLLPWVAFDV